MPEPARTTKGEATRRRLLDAARNELIENGGVVELGSVAKRAGVSPGLPYRYFSSKAELLAVVIDDFFDRLDVAVVQPSLADVPGDWWSRERVRVKEMVDFFYSEPLAPTVVSLVAGDAVVVSTQHARIARQVKAASKNIRAGQKSGDLPKTVDSDLAGALIMGGAFQCLVSALSATPRFSKRRVRRSLERMIASVLEVHP